MCVCTCACVCVQVASEVAELKVSELQTQLEDVSQQLHQALCQIQVCMKRNQTHVCN